MGPLPAQRLRPFLPRDPALAGAVLRILLRAIRTLLLKRSPTAPDDAQLGAVSFLHRFGSALNPQFHFHLVVLDGLFSEDPDGSVHFHEAGEPGTRDLQQLQQLVRRRVLRLFRRRELLDEASAANMLTWQATGGFSVDALVRISGRDRAGRERLLRYCARPPFALERLRIERVLSARSAGAAGVGTAAAGDIIRHVLYQPSRVMPDGRALLVLSPLEFLTALARLIPPPRVHRYAQWKKARVHRIDYHVAFEEHNYSAPHRLGGDSVDLRCSAVTIEIFHRGERVAAHLRSTRQGGYTTEPGHRPHSHQQHLDWSPQRMIRWASQSGPSTAAVVEEILRTRPHPEQGYRACLGIIRLSKRYSPERLEAACRRALEIRGVSYRSIKSILKNGLDQQQHSDAQATLSLPQEHVHVRGRTYYTPSN